MRMSVKRWDQSTIGSESERLRKKIDSGQTSDKVEGSDPAAAPLGTDAEAAGTPTPRQAVDSAIQQETTRRPERKNEIEKAQSRSPFAVVYLALIVTVIAAVIAGLWLAE